jgi:hypothetical protein
MKSCFKNFAASPQFKECSKFAYKSKKITFSLFVPFVFMLTKQKKLKKFKVFNFIIPDLST